MLKKNSFKIGKALYLIGLAILAVYQFFKGDLAMTRPAFGEQLAAINPAIAYISGAIILLAVLALLLRKFESQAVLVIVFIILFMVTSRHIANLWRDEINAFKSLWLISGVLLILVNDSFVKYQRHIIFFNTLVLFLFFYHCGLAHFQYVDFCKGLIPDFIPFKVFFSYSAGVCLLLGGIGLLILKFRASAALLSSFQILGWCVLLHIPRALTIGADEWIGVGETLAVAGICWMLYFCFEKEKDSK